MQSFISKLVLICFVTALCSAGFMLGTARAVARLSSGPPAGLVLSPSSAAASVVLAQLQGVGTQVGPGRQSLPETEEPQEFLAWQKMQDHLKRVELVWGTPYAIEPGGELAPDPLAPPRYVILRTFESPFDHAPLAEPQLSHAGLRFVDPATSDSWIVLLEPVAPGTFLAELADAGQYLGWGLWVEALAWLPGADPSEPASAFYRSPFIEL